MLTARERGGLCVPCFRGEREQIEDGKRSYQEWKAYVASPPYLFWRDLVNRAHGDGLGRVSPEERDYFAIGVLQGEVFNGGFYQYFSNSSGNLFDLTVAALERLGAKDALAALMDAKRLVFGAEPVGDWTQRNAALDRLEGDAEFQAGLQACDDRLCAMDRSLSEIMEEFAVANGFYPRPD